MYTRADGVWTQQGGKLVALINDGSNLAGGSVALSADGNTAILGGFSQNHVAEGWVFTRVAGLWTQQGGKLIASDANVPTSVIAAKQSVALSADGNLALLGWPDDSNHLGATWVFTRSSGIWSESGKLVGSGSFPDSSGLVWQGWSAALSGDGNTALVGAPRDTSDNAIEGGAWVFHRTGGVWSQVGGRLAATGAFGQGASVALSADGYTALVGAPSSGTFVFTSPKSSTTSLSASPNPSIFGQAVTYTATVSVGATGTVTLTIDQVPLSTVVLNGSQARFTISNLSLGSHTVRATYSGDLAFPASLSNVVNQTVNPLGVISLSATTVVGVGQAVGLPVSLTKPAPAGGLTISLASSDTSKLTVTPSVFIPGGSLVPNAQPQVKGLNQGTVRITATALGYAANAQFVRVTAP